MKKIILLMIATLFVFGCGKTTTQNVSFDNFTMDVDVNLKKIDSSLIDNKQILNKTLLSMKISNAGGFDQNMLAVKTTLTGNIDSQRFSQINMEKIKAQVSGFADIKNASYDFKCNSEDIKGFYDIFSLSSDTVKKDSSQTYYMIQYHFVKANEGYIVSFVSSDQKTTEGFVDSIKTLKCK